VWELLDSVYSRDDWTGPQFQEGPGVHGDTRLASRLPFVPHLRTALGLACEEAERRGGPDPLLAGDLVEIGQQYLGEVYNAHWLRLRAAFDENDAAAVAREGAVLRLVLEDLEALLATHPDWTLGTEVARAVRAGLPPAEAARQVKARYSYLGLVYGVGWEEYPFLLDYARRNRAELVRHYYLPRLEAYLAALARRLEDAADKPFPASPPGAAGLEAAYRKIAEAFVEGEVPLMAPAAPDGAALLAVVRHVLERPEYAT